MFARASLSLTLTGLLLSSSVTFVGCKKAPPPEQKPTVDPAVLAERAAAGRRVESELRTNHSMFGVVGVDVGAAPDGSCRVVVRSSDPLQLGSENGTPKPFVDEVVRAQVGVTCTAKIQFESRNK